MVDVETVDIKRVKNDSAELTSRSRRGHHL